MNFHQKPISHITKVNLKVQNLEHSLSFYKNVIGFQVLKKEEKTATLTADGKTVSLTLTQPENVIPKEKRTSGLYHFALLLPTRADLGEFLRHLLQIEYPIQGASDHLVSEAIYLADPDGNGIEVYRDRPKETWNWTENEVEMTTSHMDADSVIKESNEQTWKGLPAKTVMGHIHLHVSDLEKAETFYTKGLGLSVVSRYGGKALFVSYGGYHHHIGLNTWNGVGIPAAKDNSVGLTSFEMIYENEEKRNDIVEQLKLIGASVTEENEAFVTFDPSGNKILLII